MDSSKGYSASAESVDCHAAAHAAARNDREKREVSKVDSRVDCHATANAARNDDKNTECQKQGDSRGFFRKQGIPLAAGDVSLENKRQRCKRSAAGFFRKQVKRSAIADVSLENKGYRSPHSPKDWTLAKDCFF